MFSNQKVQIQIISLLNLFLTLGSLGTQAQAFEEHISNILNCHVYESSRPNKNLYK